MEGVIVTVQSPPLQPQQRPMGVHKDNQADIDPEKIGNMVDLVLGRHAHVPDPSRGCHQPLYGDDLPDWTGVHNQPEEECTDPHTTTGLHSEFSLPSDKLYALKKLLEKIKNWGRTTVQELS